MTQPAQEPTTSTEKIEQMMTQRKEFLEKTVNEMEDKIKKSKSELIQLQHSLLGLITGRQATEISELEYGVIVENVTKVFPCVQHDLISESRKREIVIPRQLCMYFMQKFTNQSLKSIGSHFGDRDHSTVIHALKAINDIIDTDTKMAIKINNIELELVKIFKP